MTSNTKVAVGVVALVVVAFLTYGYLTMPDQRSTGDRIGDAVDQLENGVDDAARELEPRTPGERLGDEIEDRTDGNPN